LVVVAVTTVPMFALASASLLASVWSKQTRDAVLGLYAAGGAATLVLWLLGGLHLFDPLHVLEPAWGQARLRDLQELGRRLLVYGSAWGLVAVVCFGLAVWRLRPAYLQQLEGEGRKKQARWWRVERLPVGDDPVPWKEQHVDGLAPVTFLRRFPRWLAMLLIFAVTLISSAFLLWSNRAAGTTLEELVRKAAHLHYVDLAERVTGAGKGFLIQSVAVMLLASLVVGIRCSGAVTGERERQTWEALLLTPLTARELIRGKLWGIMGASYLYVLAYAVPALVLAALPILAADFAPLFWTAIWLAVTLLAMYFVGAAGIWCSVRARTSWRSLLGTLGLGYVGGAVIALVTSPVTAMLAGIIYLFLQAFDAYYGTSATLAIGGKATFTNALLIALSLSLAAIFYGLSWYFLKDAQKWVSDRERTRHWNEVPQFRRPLYRRPADAKRPRL
jgi:ABC-type transport system involved in multi-copper enzyme maturation permease subunit